MGKINSRAKGAAGEREFAGVLREAGFEARRGQQFSGSPDSPDVVTNLPLHFEVKRVEAFNVYNGMEQAMRDSEPSKVPVVAYRKNKKEWLAVLRMEDFLNMMKKLHSTPKPRVVRRIRRVS